MSALKLVPKIWRNPKFEQLTKRLIIVTGSQTSIPVLFQTLTPVPLVPLSLDGVFFFKDTDVVKAFPRHRDAVKQHSPSRRTRRVLLLTSHHPQLLSLRQRGRL